MTNKQMNPESIDRIEHSTYTPLEKKYLKVQFVKVALVYLSLMAVSLTTIKDSLFVSTI